MTIAWPLWIVAALALAAGAFHLARPAVPRWFQIATAFVGLACAGLMAALIEAEGMELEEWGLGAYLAAAGILALLGSASARPPARAAPPASPPPVAAGGYTA